MKRFESIKYGAKDYPVEFKQTRKWSHTTMDKQGLVIHVTTSNSYSGGLGWLVDGYDPATKTYGNGGSAHFIVGRNVGEIAMLGELNQMLWHAGRISRPTDVFKEIAKLKNDDSFVNPNLYLDGIEFVGGVDEDHSGKVEHDEVNLTEWQYACGEAIARWHAETCGYPLEEKRIITHEDIYYHKPELGFVREELLFRLFRKDAHDVVVCGALQEQVGKQQTMIEQLIKMVKLLLTLRK